MVKCEKESDNSNYSNKLGSPHTISANRGFRI